MQEATKEWIKSHGGEAEIVLAAPLHVDRGPNLIRVSDP